jgi:hypothetical protein
MLPSFQSPSAIELSALDILELLSTHQKYKDKTPVMTAQFEPRLALSARGTVWLTIQQKEGF